MCEWEIKAGDRVVYNNRDGYLTRGIVRAIWSDADTTWTAVYNTVGNFQEIVLMTLLTAIKRPDGMTDTYEQAVRYLVRDGHKIHAIAIVRAITKIGLAEAKYYVESL